jgi:hypothetical protein
LTGFVRRLFGFGQVIESALDVPGAVQLLESDLREPSIRIELVARVSSPSECVYAVDGDDLFFSPPGVARYRCRPGSIAVAPQEGADAEAVTALLIATALPAVLWMQGHFMLHAAAVCLPDSDHVMAIAGRSGSGKSTIADELVAAGAALVADDSLCLAIGGREVRGSGLPGGVHAPIADSAARTFHPVADRQPLAQGPLGVVFVLGETSGAWSIERLGTTAAIEMLLAQRHRASVPALLGRRAQVLEDCARIAGTVAIYAWRRPRDKRPLSPLERATLAHHMQRREDENE